MHTPFLFMIAPSKLFRICPGHVVGKYSIQWWHVLFLFALSWSTCQCSLYHVTALPNFAASVFIHAVSPVNLNIILAFYLLLPPQLLLLHCQEKSRFFAAHYSECFCVIECEGLGLLISLVLLHPLLHHCLLWNHHCCCVWFWLPTNEVNLQRLKNEKRVIENERRRRGANRNKDV